MIDQPATIYQPEHCWRCSGFAKIPCRETESNPSGCEPCPECKGTGYGKSLETMWARTGVKPS